MILAFWATLCFAPLDETQAILLEDLYQPACIEIDPAGLLYIADEGNANVMVFDNNGKLIRTIGRQGQGPGEFQNPLDVVIFADRTVAVSDGHTNKIQFFDKEGQYLRELRFSHPVGRIYPFGDRQLLMTRDTGRNMHLKLGQSSPEHRFAVYDLDGNEVRRFGDWQPHENPLFEIFSNTGPTTLQGDTFVFAKQFENILITYAHGTSETHRYPLSFEPREPNVTQEKRKNPNGTYDIFMKTEADRLCGAIALLPNGELLMMRATRPTEAETEVPFERVHLSATGQVLKKYPGKYLRPQLVVAPQGDYAYLLHETDAGVWLEKWQLTTP